MTKPLIAAALGLCCTLLPAQAQDANVLATRSLAATCANCHGTDGRAVEGAAVPGLAGLNPSYFGEQMNAFKSGARQATVMHQIAKGFSDAQIAALAAYFAAQTAAQSR